MEIGSFYSHIQAAEWERGLSLSDALTIARSHGVTAIDVWAGDFETIPPEELRQILKEHGMRVCSVHGYTVCDVQNRAAINASVKQMKQQMRNALLAGSPYFMIVPQKAESYEESEREQFVEGIREIFVQLASYGKEIGIQATVENISDVFYPYASFDDIRWYLENIPDIRYTYDSGNFTLAGFDELEGAKIFADKTVYVHLKDVEVVPESDLVRNGICYEGPAIDDGIVKNQEAVEYLKRKGYDGVLTIEICSEEDTFHKMLLSADRYAKYIK